MSLSTVQLLLLGIVTVGLQMSTVAAVRRFRSRHQGQKVHPACLEPSQRVEESVYEWLEETSKLAQHEAMEDEWKQAPLQKEICDSEPETGAGTTIMERSLCPWQWRVNREEDREPKEILEAHCLCQKSRGSSGSLCTPILREVAVLKKVICDSQHFEYVRAVQTITVGCHSVLPRIEQSSPFRFFLNPYSQEI